MNKTITNLKKLKSFHNGSYGADIDMAIKALEQEPCEEDEADRIINELEEKGLLEEVCENHRKISTISEEEKSLEQQDALDKIYANIQKLRGCSCSYSDGIIDDVEDIIDKYKADMKGEKNDNRLN